MIVGGVMPVGPNLQEWQDANGNLLMSIGNSGAFAGSIDVMAYASTISLTTKTATLHKTTATDAVGNATINANTAGNTAQEMTVLIINNGMSPKIITLGNNFRSAGNLTVVSGRAAVVRFISDGTAWFEVCRTVPV